MLQNSTASTSRDAHTMPTHSTPQSTATPGQARSLPAQCATRLIFDHACLEEVALLLQIDHLAHPWERILFVREKRIKTNLLTTTIRDEAQIALEHRCVQAQHAARHRVFGVTVFEFDRFLEDRVEFGAERRRPEMRVLELDL